MKYFPDIISANPKQTFQHGKYTIGLFDNIVSEGSIRYRYVISVLDERELPCFMVTSEVNSVARIRGGGSHFLCIFDGEGHLNLSGSDDWGNEAKFTTEALRIIKEKFGSQSVVQSGSPPSTEDPKPTNAGQSQELYGGGDGSSLERAVIVNTADPEFGVDAEYQFVSLQCGSENQDWKFQSQNLQTHEGIPYDILTIELADGGTRDFYFNISNFFGKGPSNLDWLLAD